MQKLPISFMKDLKNIEFEELFDIISTIIATDKIGLPLLTMACEQLQPHAQELLKMNNQKIKHPLTQILSEQVKTRTEYLACLRMTIDAKMMCHKPTERVAAKYLELWLNNYKDDIYAPSISKQSRMVDNLMADRKEDTTIKEATTLLDLDELLDEIVKLTANIRHNQLTRINEKDQYEVDGQSIRKAAYKDLKVLVIVIEATYNTCTDEYQRKQIADLSLTLSAVLQEFHTKLKSRNTKSKNKKETIAAVKELIDCELKESKQDSDKYNFPMVIYDELKIKGNLELPETYEASASFSSLQPHKGSIPKPRAIEKGEANDKKANIKKGANNLFTYINDKDNRKIGGDGGLPPICKN